MRVKDYDGGKLVILSEAFDSREKLLFFSYFILFLFAGLLFLRLGLTDPPITFVDIILMILTSTVFFGGCIRFVDKVVESEQLFVKGNLLQISTKKFFSNKTKAYDIRNIENFRHLDKKQISRHPLSGDTFDYLGFQTEQKVINEMHGENRLAFDYNGQSVFFGQNIYSYDFDELEILLFDLTNNDFRYTDKYEQDHFNNE